MQFTSSMHDMPQDENQSGFKLRDGQEELVRFIALERSKRIISAQFPTGYGKTICAALAYREYQRMNLVNRVLVVVPTLAQRDQYRDGFKDAAAKVGLTIRGVKEVDGATITLRLHRENRADVFVVTVAQLAAWSRNGNGFIHDLIASGNWFLVADEHHHYSEEIPWGQAVKELRVERILALSATPYRSDKASLVFGKPDVSLTLKDAANEQAIKQVTAHIEHYFVDVMTEDGEIIPLHTETLRDESLFPEGFSQWQLKKNLRYLSKYISPIFANALNCWMAKSMRHPGQHQMIVYAMSCAHAKSLVEAVRALSLGCMTADWVGVGDDGRDEKENTKLLSDFKAGKLDCLIQVNKASEGFDVIRASVLVFLNLIGKTPQAEQQIGRGLRRNHKIPYAEDICDLFVPSDSDLAEVARTFEALTVPMMDDEEHPDKTTREGNGEREFWPEIPEWSLISVRHDRSEIVIALKPDDPRVEKFAKAIIKESSRTGITLDMENPEHMQKCAEIYAICAQQHINQQSIDEELRQARQLSNKAVNICAGHYARWKCRGQEERFEKSLVGDVARRINSHWKKMVGAHEEMTLEEHQTKYQWLQELSVQIRRGEIPLWLSI